MLNIDVTRFDHRVGSGMYTCNTWQQRPEQDLGTDEALAANADCSRPSFFAPKNNSFKVRQKNHTKSQS
jgi:hypothetical protein